MERKDFYSVKNNFRNIGNPEKEAEYNAFELWQECGYNFSKLAEENGKPKAKKH